MCCKYFSSFLEFSRLCFVVTGSWIYCSFWSLKGEGICQENLRGVRQGNIFYNDMCSTYNCSRKLFLFYYVFDHRRFSSFTFIVCEKKKLVLHSQGHKCIKSLKISSMNNVTWIFCWPDICISNTTWNIFSSSLLSEENIVLHRRINIHTGNNLR